MEYFPRLYTGAESNAFIDANKQHIEQAGWGCWAVEVISSGAFIGFVGFSRPAHWHPCASSIDIGWRIAYDHWGNGYATEAATLVLKLGFDSFGFEELVSFTSATNTRSINVMKKIGMHQDLNGFDHPRIDEKNPLRAHVVYRLAKVDYSTMQSIRP